MTEVARTLAVASGEVITDEEVVARVLAGETAFFEIIMRRYNQRLYRAARAILRDDAQAEEVVQAAYVQAYEHLPQFAGRASFAAWLIRIAVNEGLARLRRRKLYENDAGEGDRMDRFASPMPDPEQAAATSEICKLLEQMIEALPDGNRAVFILRDVEGMSTAETSDALHITEENVKTRLHRARSALRKALSRHVTVEVHQTFQFGATRCDRVVKDFYDRLQRLSPDWQSGRESIH
jgi:RNA polymerase sigma-70 factor (ECF subfamily)